MENLKWIPIKNSKIQSFRLEDEPEVIHVLKIRNDEYIVLYEDGYDLKTGKTEFYNLKDLKSKFKINIK